MLAHKFNILHKGIGALVVDTQNKIFVHKRSKMKKVFPSMLDMFIGLKKSCTYILKKQQMKLFYIFLMSQILSYVICLFIGGVSGVDELPVETLRREINEEIGVELFKQETADELFKAYTKVNSRTHRNLFFKSHRLSAAISNSSVLSDSNDVINGTDLEIEYQNFKNDEMKRRTSIVPGNQIYKLGRTICQTNYNHCLVDIYCVAMDDVSSQSIAFRDGEIESGEWLSFSELIQKLSDGGRQKFVPDGLQVWDALVLNKLEKE
jgi:isopentenyldiphosphate isomerase